MAAKRVPEQNRELWLLAAAPGIWAAHLLGSYALAAIWCAKLGGGRGEEVSLDRVRLVVALFTVVALAGIALVGRGGWRRHRLPGGDGLPHDADSPEDRHRFLGFATLLLAGLSAVAVIYASLAVVFVRSCR
jgi:hypothetical protein